MIVTSDRLRRFAPHGRPDILDVIADDVLASGGIDTPLRVRHFLAQCAVETGGFQRLEEDLNYSAPRLIAVWPSRFPNIGAAAPYAHNPRKLANKVYGGRMGNHQVDDGWTYRGSGMLQTSGRDNFRAAGHEDDPDTLRQPAGALAGALKFWTDHALNVIADRDDIFALRKHVNGGTNGLADCRIYLKSAKAIFA